LKNDSESPYFLNSNPDFLPCNKPTVNFVKQRILDNPGSPYNRPYDWDYGRIWIQIINFTKNWIHYELAQSPDAKKRV